MHGQDRRPVQGGGYRTAALSRAVVTGPSRPGRAVVPSLNKKMQEERGKKEKIKHVEAERGMRDISVYLARFSRFKENTLQGDLYHHWGMCNIILAVQYPTIL
ncbi:hypothetical protein KI387_030228, partial [Taxus chinensis]